MEKRGEPKGQGSYLRSMLYGLLGAGLFMGLLLAAAGLGDRHGAIMDAGRIVSKGCLLLSAVVCALLAGKQAGQGKLMHALCAEGVLLCVLAISAVSLSADVRLMSLVADLALLLIGAFAGIMLSGKRYSKRRGKR